MSQHISIFSHHQFVFYRSQSWRGKWRTPVSVLCLHHIYKWDPRTSYQLDLHLAELLTWNKDKLKSNMTDTGEKTARDSCIKEHAALTQKVGGILKKRILKRATHQIILLYRTVRRHVAAHLSFVHPNLHEIESSVMLGVTEFKDDYLGKSEVANKPVIVTWQQVRGSAGSRYILPLVMPPLFHNYVHLCIVINRLFWSVHLKNNHNWLVWSTDLISFCFSVRLFAFHVHRCTFTFYICKHVYV